MTSVPRRANRSTLRRPSRTVAGYLAIGIALLLLPGAPLALPASAHSAPQARAAPTSMIPKAAVLPAGTTGSLFLTVSNDGDQPTATYEQKIVVDSLQYSYLINSNWSNGAAFYAANGTPIYLWIESGATNLSTQTVLWLRLYSIPIGGQVVVVLEFQPKPSFLLSESGFTGESPLLSGSYGKFDNGWRVFNFYDNFSGTSLSGKWTTSGTWTSSVDNGISITGIPGSGGYISSLATFAFPETVDFYGDLYESASASSFDVEGIGSSGCTACGTGSSVGFDAGGGGSLYGPAPWVGLGSNGWWGTPVLASQTYATFTTLAVGSDEAQYLLNYSSPITELTPLPSSPLPVGLAMSGSPSGTATNTEQTYWIRERTSANTSVSALQTFVTGSVALSALPGTLGAGQSLTLSVSVGAWPPVTYSYSGLPPGCTSIDQPTLSCRVSTPGQYSPTVVITAAVGDSITAATNVTVTSSTSSPGGLTVLLAAVPSTVRVNASLTLIASVSGGTAPLTFSYTGLPPGCASQDRSYVSCEPSAAGSFTVAILVTDSLSLTANASAGVAVLPSVGQPLAVSLTSYSGTLLAGSPLLLVASVSGGVAPYSFVYSGLPGGCSGANASSIACVPTATGPYSINVVVTDAARTVASGSTSLTLGTAAAPVTSAGSGLSTDQGYELAAGVVVGVLLGVVAIALTIGRRRGDRSSPPPSN
jgi:hypothetical protein